MADTISINEINQLRREFKEYLKATHRDWKDATVSMHYSDAFYAFNNSVSDNFWALFVSDEALLSAKDKIRKFIESTKGTERAVERADGYYGSMRYFKAFLDAEYPTLAKEWSKKAIADTYMKSAFQVWMKKQKKSNGEPYSPNTITAYVTALKNSTAKLKLATQVNLDLFHYTNAIDFAEAHKIILAAPNFNEVDIAAGNKAYSNGMVLFSRFLNEIAEPACWIFQGNPKYYNVIGAVNDLDQIVWSVNQYPKQIKKGDKAYIWVSGSDGGIVASGTIAENPEIKAPDFNDPYFKETLKDEPYLGVLILLDRKFTENPVKRTVLLSDKRTKRLEILAYPGATNFSVTKEQEKVIESIIGGNYTIVPALTTPAVVEIKNKTKYWIYAPGEGSHMWDEFYEKGIMGIGWGDMGNLKDYVSKEAMKEKMKELYGNEYSYRNDALATWQFANELQVGDVVYAKKGMTKVIGRGIVESEYKFDEARDQYKHIHRVMWTHKGEWDHPGQAVMKTLTDITSYMDYLGKLESLFTDDIAGIEIKEKEIDYPDYSDSDFLDEVFMDTEKYYSLVNLLKIKKNIILQGAPGVGKTFAAKRLAYSVMGKKDSSRVMMVQFHQSYSYEDFIMGYRPTETGFELKLGPFYDFCKKAQDDNERSYFFIIDEINRGNLSKIFGELFMLIEKDKRGEELRLLYKNEMFSVPKNLHIIGMLNTADRSLAMIDYALRRRFAFFELTPAFNSEGFISILEEANNPKFNTLVAQIKMLNNAISKDEALGEGFRIGHSYFCTDEGITDEWLNGIVKYELIPLLAEYWFDEPAKVADWSKRLQGALHD